MMEMIVSSPLFIRAFHIAPVLRGGVLVGAPLHLTMTPTSNGVSVMIHKWAVSRFI